MRKPCAISLILFVLFMCAVAICSPTPKPVAPTQNSISSSDTTEVAVLRAQLDTMRDYQQHLLATVYWSLGGVFLLVLLVAGLNLFANYRMYDRDKAALVTALEGKFQQLSGTLSNSIKTQMQQEREGLPKMITAAAKHEVTSVANDLASLRSEIARHNWQEAAFRAQMYEIQGNLYEAFGMWITSLEYLREWGLMWDAIHVGDILGKLSAILTKGQSISYGFRGRLGALLKVAPPLLEPEVKKFNSLLENAVKI